MPYLALSECEHLDNLARMGVLHLAHHLLACHGKGNNQALF